jgi:hypothetical protein
MDKMQYPNTRYGNPEEFEYYAQGLSNRELAKQLKRSEKIISLWRKGDVKMPWWVPEIMRHRHFERIDRMRQMGMKIPTKQLPLFKNNVLPFRLEEKTTLNGKSNGIDEERQSAQHGNPHEPVNLPDIRTVSNG